MFDKLLQIIAPHHCYVCSETGVILCNSCIYDITYDTFAICFDCLVPTRSGVCSRCQPALPFTSAWVVGKREERMKQLLHDYKFSRVYAAHDTFARLLDETIPILPLNTIVVSVPTIAHHIRLRGYDHAALIARCFARRRGLVYSPVLKRKTNTVQVGAGKALRRRQARDAFMCSKKISTDVPYLVIDDIITTGATLTSAAKCLQQAGAKQIIVAAIAR